MSSRGRKKSKGEEGEGAEARDDTGALVCSLVTELAQALNPTFHAHKDDGKAKALVDRALRLLRPAGDVNEHAPAVKQRLRRSILDTSGSDGPNDVSLFERECDNLRNQSPHLLNTYLALMQPLSFSRRENLVAPISLARSIDILESQRDHTAKTTFSEIVAEQKLLETSNYNANVDQTDPSRSPLDAMDAMDAMDQGPWISKETEKKLLIDLIYILQGISGRHIKFDPRSSTYVINPALHVNGSVRDTVLCICELGWVYCRVSDYLKTIFSDSNDFPGLVIQAFGFGLQEELNDYYRLLAVLEQELTQGEGSSTIPAKQSNPSVPAPAPSRIAPIDSKDYHISYNNHKGHTNGSSKTNHRSSSVSAAASASGLTLLRLRAWMQEPIERMSLMARLVDSAGPFKGGALVSRLHAHSLHGDPSAHALVKRIMFTVCAPLYLMVIRWLLQGELHDPHEEFFIGMNVDQQHNPSQHDGETFSSWQHLYFLRPSMLPSFLEQTVAEKILVIGKSINYIKLCEQRLPKGSRKDETSYDRQGRQEKPKQRKSYRQVTASKGLGMYGKVVDRDTGRVSDEEESEDDATDEDDDNGRGGGGGGDKSPDAPSQKDFEESLRGFKYGAERQLTDVVAGIQCSVNARLLHLMHSRFNITTHLFALKKFLLLGQGDFVTCLMDSIGPELKKRASQQYRHNLTGLLEGALRSSNAQYEPSWVLDRVGIRLLEAVPGDTGWEVFSLDYIVDLPINAVVTTEAMCRYRIAFHMLWRLKRVEWSLSNAWKRLNSFVHTGGGDIVHSLKNIFHRCTLTRGHMVHLVNNLCAFLMFEVLETAWITLQTRIQKAISLDDVIEAHTSYLSDILERALLKVEHEGLNMHIQQVLQVVLRFCSLEETLIADATASISRMRLSRGQSEKNTRRGMWGSVGEDDEDDPYGGIPDYVIIRLDEAAREYGRQVTNLMQMLQEEGEKEGHVLRFLTFRLDFNTDFPPLSHGMTATGKPFHGILDRGEVDRD